MPRVVTFTVLVVLAGFGAAADLARSDEAPLITGKLISAPVQATYEYPAPDEIISGADGALWFSENKRVGRMTTSGALTWFAVPGGGKADAIATGPSGSVWFAGEDAVGRITPSPTAFKLKGAKARALALGADGAIWVAESGAGRIARVTSAGVVKLFASWRNGFQPEGIVRGPDGRLWIADAGNDNIIAMTTSGNTTTYRTPARESHPGAIIAGKDGALWFTEPNADNIGRITVSGSFREFPLHSEGGRDPKFNPSPGYLAWGPDGNIWFTEGTLDAVRRLSPSGALKDFATKSSEVTPAGIVTGSDGNLWYAENAASKIAQVTPAGMMTEFPLVLDKPDVYTADWLTPAVAAGLWLGRSGSEEWSIGLLSAGGLFNELSRAVSPVSVTSDADGNLWFVDARADKLDSMSATGALVEYALPSPRLGEFIVAQDRSIWFIDSKYNKIVHVSLPLGKPMEFTIPTLISDPRSPALDKAGDVWFTEAHANKIGKLTAAGAFTEYRIPRQDMAPRGLVIAADGSAWFMEEDEYGEDDLGRVGRVDARGKVSDIKLWPAAAYVRPKCIVADRAGNVWVAAEGNPQPSIARISSDGKVDKFAIPTPNSYPTDCALSSDGDVWFLEQQAGNRVLAGSLGKVTPLGVVSEYRIVAP